MLRLDKIARVNLEMQYISDGPMVRIREMLENVRLDQITFVTHDFDDEQG